MNVKKKVYNVIIILIKFCLFFNSPVVYEKLMSYFKYSVMKVAHLIIKQIAKCCLKLF